MALPKTAGPGKFYFVFEDPNSVGTYLDPCGLESFTATFDDEVVEDTIFDCDPSVLRGVMQRFTIAESLTVSASGKLATGGLADFRAIRDLGGDGGGFGKLVLGVAAADGGGHWEAQFVMPKFEVTGGRKTATTQVSIDVSSNGAITWVDAT